MGLKRSGHLLTVSNWYDLEMRLLLEARLGTLKENTEPLCASVWEYSANSNRMHCKRFAHFYRV